MTNLSHCLLLTGLAAAALVDPWTVSARAEPAGTPMAAAARLSEPGAEEKQLRALEGTYDVTAKMWPAPGADPIVTTDLIAERKMIGSYLQEILRPAPGSDMPEFQRIDYMNFDRVEGRWKYVSMDTRLPVSIMPASSFASAEGSVIRMLFQPQAFVGLGADVEGRFMLSDMVIDLSGDLRSKEQNFNFATGDGKPRRFTRYEYIRRR